MPTRAVDRQADLGRAPQHRQGRSELMRHVGEEVELRLGCRGQRLRRRALLCVRRPHLGDHAPGDGDQDRDDRDQEEQCQDQRLPGCLGRQRKLAQIGRGPLLGPGVDRYDLALEEGKREEASIAGLGERNRILAVQLDRRSKLGVVPLRHEP